MAGHGQGMFGYDPEEAARILRGPPRLRPWVVVVCLLLVTPVLLAVAVIDQLNKPERIEYWLSHAFKDGPFRLSLRDLEVLPPTGPWDDPESWSFAVTDLSFRPNDPKKPEWSAQRVLLGLPRIERAPQGYVLHFRMLRVSGLAIQAHQQRPPPPWEPVEGIIHAIRVDDVEIFDASFDTPPDEPLGPANTHGIRGRLKDLLYAPGLREVSAVGAVHLDDFTTGAITIDDVELSEFELDHSTLRFVGHFFLGKRRASLDGEIADFHIKSKVDLHVRIEGVQLVEIVKLATGNEGPVQGVLDLDVRVQAGGNRERGKSQIDGVVRLTDGRVQLGRTVRPMFLDIIRVAPWVKLNSYNQVELEEMRGRIGFTRGTATLKELTYPAGRRQLRVDGTIGTDELYMLIRLMPPPERSDRPGIGGLLWGPPNNPRFRLARSEDMLREAPWEPLQQPEFEMPEVAPRAPKKSRKARP